MTTFWLVYWTLLCLFFALGGFLGGISYESRRMKRGGSLRR